jgi:DNA repair photolyase
MRPNSKEAGYPWLDGVVFLTMIAVNVVEAKSLVSKSRLPTADYVVNPYTGCPHKCIYCYAEFMKRFTNHKEEWGDFLDVKLYSKKIQTKKYDGKDIVFCSVTDAYNPFEKKYENTKKILEQFAGCGARINILTKSDLVVRDIEILKKLPHVSVGLSMNTLDDEIRKKTEPRAASIDRRIEALRILHSAGINTWLFISPMFPGITDMDTVKKIVSRCKSSADFFGFENLNLRGAYYPRVMKYIKKYHVHLVPLFEQIYKHKNKEYWEIMEQEIQTWCRKNKINYINYFYHEKIRKN